MRKIILLYVFPIILLWFGIIQIIHPEKTFMYWRRWMFTKDSQLSDIMIILIRVEGVILILGSLWILIKGIQLN